MTATNIPCTKPDLCGVKTHRPGTVADCMKTGAGRASSGNALGLSAAPKPLNSSGYPTGTWSPEVHSIAEAWEWSEDTKSRDIRVADNIYGDPELYEVTTPDQLQPGDQVILVSPNQSYGEAVSRIKNSGPDAAKSSKTAPLRWRNVVDKTEDGSLVVQRMDENGESWPYRPDLVPTEGFKIIRAVNENNGEPVKWDGYRQYESNRPESNPDLIEGLNDAKAKNTPEFQRASKAAGAMARIGIGLDPHKFPKAKEVDEGIYLVEDVNGNKAVVFDNAQVTSRTRTTGYIQKNVRGTDGYTTGLYQGEGSTDVRPELSGGDFGDGHRWSTPYLTDSPLEATKSKYGHLVL